MKNIIKNVKNSLNLADINAIIKAFIASIIIGFCLLGITFPRGATCADFSSTTDASYVAQRTNDNKKILKTIKVAVTAYSSTPDQTDDTPFITASGEYVKDGIVAINSLPFGTKIKIPKLYGDKVFVVQDRMNKKKGKYHLDIWMPSRDLAVHFGFKKAEIQILED